MSAFLIYFICSFLFIIFYITRDEIRRARDKRSGALVKRLPRTEPWVWSIYIPVFTGMSIYMLTHLAEFQTILVVFSVGAVLFGLIGMYYYETKYLRFNPDNTITYRNKPFKSTHLQYDEILGYTYVQEPKEKITLYHKNNNVTLSIGSQDFSYLMSQIIFRQTHGRWAVMNAREDLREIIYTMDDTIYAPWLINHPKAMFS